MPSIPYAERIGSASTPKVRRQATLYLLNEAYRVVGVCPVTRNESVLQKERLFFKQYPLPQDQMALLTQSLRAHDDRSLLLSSSQGPLLVVTALFRRTGLLLVALPHGALAHRLKNAFCYADALQGAHVLTSRSLRDPTITPTANRYRAISMWIEALHQPLFVGRLSDVGSDVSLEGIAHHLSHLAAACGCTLTCDLSALDRQELPQIDLPLILGVTAAALMLAHRAALGRRMTLRAVCELGQTPLLELSLVARHDIADLSELSPFAQHPAWAGKLFLVYRDPKMPKRHCILFDFCSKELSVQGVKVENPYLVDAKGDLSLPFSEE